MHWELARELAKKGELERTGEDVCEQMFAFPEEVGIKLPCLPSRVCGKHESRY